MTACKEAQGATPGKKAVGATLAGVLAVGMVPAAAFADAAADQPEEGGVELLSADAAAAFSQGKVTAAKDSDGNAIADLSKIEFVADGKPHIVIPTEVTPAVGNAVDVTDDVLYDVSWFKANDKGELPDEADRAPIVAPKEVGTYYAVITADGGDYKGGQVAIKFSIVNASLDGVTAYEKQKDEKDLSDTTFTYNGKAQEIGFALDGKALTEGTDYEVKYFTPGTATQVGTPTNAGSYIAVIEGQGIYAKSSVEVPVTVDKLDLSQAAVKLADRTGSAAPTADDLTVNGESDLNSDLEIAFKQGPSTSLYGKVGAYTYTVSPKKEAEQNVTGTADVTFNKVTAQIDDTDVTYDGAAWNTLTSPMVVNISDKDPKYFDASKIEVKGTDGKALKAEQYELVVTNDKDEAATVDDLKTPGTWKVSVKVKADATEYELGGETNPLTVEVKNATINADANVFVSYKGTVTSGTIEAPYNGKNVIDDLAVVVKDGKGKDLVAGTDYEVKYTTPDKNGKDQEVSEIVNAGTYKLSVAAKNGYVFTGTTDLTIKVDPISVTAVQIKGMKSADDGATFFLPYTGKDIDLAFTYATTVDGKLVTDIDLPTDIYKVSIVDKDNKPVEALKDKGAYGVTVSLNDSDAAKNYTLDPSVGPLVVNVDDQRVFADVPSSEWYYDAIYKAAGNEYMTGYADTKFFGPNDDITRGQVACVLFNMAGGSASTNNDWYNDLVGWKSFDDVNGKAYYGEAIAWAKNAGVVNGYGDGTFKADQTVTREEFAAMLANYAQKTGADLTKDVDGKDIDIAATLKAFPDGSDVSDWAKNAVAWAAANKLMGKGGVIDPSASITRAEVAAMAVDYQPNGKLGK